MPRSTADIKEKVHIRSDATTHPPDRQRIWKQIQELFDQWQTRGLIPAVDQPGPTRAHRKAAVDYENGEYLNQQEAWEKAGRTSWLKPGKSAINKADNRKTTVTILILHLKYVSKESTNSMYVVQEADLPAKKDRNNRRGSSYPNSKAVSKPDRSVSSRHIREQPFPPSFNSSPKCERIGV